MFSQKKLSFLRPKGRGFPVRRRELRGMKRTYVRRSEHEIKHNTVPPRRDYEAVIFLLFLFPIHRKFHHCFEPQGI